ncbi:HPP family protein, partial [Streptomyces sp. BR123]|uniref:HPP family protein n=1 Tax=Streptomyces sp. BR123 TaxID=2749828 RepID=UPI00211AE71F
LGAGAAVGLMTLARTPHSPAAATTVVVVLQAPQPEVFVPLLAGAALLLVLAGTAASRARAGAVRYPVFWWREPVPSGGRPDPGRPHAGRRGRGRRLLPGRRATGTGRGQA